MSKYSSDSDSSSGHRKSRHTRRSSSSSSSYSSRRYKSKKNSSHHSSSRHKKSKNYSSNSRRRSRSRSRTHSRHSRSQSKDKLRRRSRSYDKYKHSRHHHKSRSHSKSHSSRYHSRSSSNDTHSRQSRSPKRSNSSDSSPKRVEPGRVQTVVSTEEQLREKLLQAIKAAESADHQLKEQGVLPKGVKSRNDLSVLTNIRPAGDTIKDINTDEFFPKSFTSSKNKKNLPQDDTEIDTPEIPNVTEDDGSSIFHASFFADPKSKMDRWIKKLYSIRQRAVCGEPLSFLD